MIAVFVASLMSFEKTYHQTKKDKTEAEKAEKLAS